jgi:hypothetical protein
MYYTAVMSKYTVRLRISLSKGLYMYVARSTVYCVYNRSYIYETRGIIEEPKKQSRWGGILWS